MTNAGYHGISLATPQLGNVSMLKDETRAPITLAELQRRAVPHFETDGKRFKVAEYGQWVFNKLDVACRRCSYVYVPSRLY